MKELLIDGKKKLFPSHFFAVRMQGFTGRGFSMLRTPLLKNLSNKR